MTDAEFEAQRERIRPITEKWRERMRLQGWYFHFIYDRAELREENDDDMIARNVAGRAKVNWPYLSASISFSLPLVQGMDDDEVEKLVVHEFGHVLVREMRDDKDNLDHEERVVTTIERAFRECWQSGVEEGKRQALSLGDGAVREEA